jgi:hypothetical protein
VIAQSATGTCHGPTIGSRHDRPPTVRSPIVIRKRLLATVGWRRTSNATVFELDVGEVERRQREPMAAHVAVHLRRLAEENVHRHVDGRGAIVIGRRRGERVDRADDELARIGRDADDGVRAALAHAHRVEERQRLLGHRHDVALLALVAPDLLRRQAALLDRHLAQVEARAAAGAVDELGERIREAAGADVVDRQDRVRAPSAAQVVDDLLRTALDLGIAALHRIEVELGGVGAGGHRARRAAAHADAHAGPAEVDQQGARPGTRSCASATPRSRRGRRRS